MMQSLHRQKVQRWLACLCFWLAITSAAPRAAAEAESITTPLDERVLTHLEATAQHLTAKQKADPALKKDFRACASDKKITGETADAISASIAARHPRLTTALAAEGWKPGDFYVAFATAAMLPLASEFSRGGIPDTDKVARSNVAFFDHHKARVLAVVNKLNPLAGTDPAKD